MSLGAKGVGHNYLLFGHSIHFYHPVEGGSRQWKGRNRRERVCLSHVRLGDGTVASGLGRLREHSETWSKFS
jgi:hypothetical protein